MITTETCHFYQLKVGGWTCGIIKIGGSWPEFPVTVVLRIWKIISRNLWNKYSKVSIAKVKKIFPLAAHIRDNLRYWADLVILIPIKRADNVQISNDAVSLKVYDKIYFAKQEKLLTSILYQGDKHFPLAVQISHHPYRGRCWIYQKK